MKLTENTCTCIGADLRIADDYRFHVFGCTHMHSHLAQFTRGGNGVAMLIKLNINFAIHMALVTTYIGKLNIS